MPKFVVVYRYRAGYDVLTDPNANAEWEAFIRDKVGPNVVDPGWPVFEDATIVGTSGSPTKLGSYSVIDAKDLDAAVTLTDTCPTLAKGGRSRVGRQRQRRRQLDEPQP